MRPLRLCARYKRIRRHGEWEQQKKTASLFLPSPTSMPSYPSYAFPFAVVGNCFRFPVEWKFAKLTNDCNCVCKYEGVCVRACVCVTENALYAVGNVRKFNNILIRLHFKGVSRLNVFFPLCLPRLKFHLNSF